MRAAAVRERKPTNVSQTAVGKRFGRYTPEKEKAVRKADVKEDAVLKQLKEVWKGCGPMPIELKDYYERLSDFILTKKLSYSSKDIERFSIALIEFQDEERFVDKAGFFLSVLMNNGNDSHYTIHTNHLDKSINWLGYRNTKNIIVNGNAGDAVGCSMKSGTIIVNGNTMRYAGASMEDGTITVNGNVDIIVGECMRGGTLIIKGSTGDYIGGEMKGGCIIIEGNCRYGVGFKMEGGEIHMRGNYKTLGGIKGGRIYHKGNLIFSK